MRQIRQHADCPVRAYVVTYRHRITQDVDTTSLCWGGLASCLTHDDDWIYPYFPFTIWRDGHGYVSVCAEDDGPWVDNLGEAWKLRDVSGWDEFFYDFAPPVDRY